MPLHESDFSRITAGTLSCWLHVNAGGLLGNVLDVVISAMVFAMVSGCKVTIGTKFDRGKKQIAWDEITAIRNLQIEDNHWVSQLRIPPMDLEHVCSEFKPHIQTCTFGVAKLTLGGLSVFQGRDVAITTCNAFVPPGTSRQRFFELYAMAAKMLRLKTKHFGGDYYATEALPKRTLALHLRTGYTTYDKKRNSTWNEARFIIPYERLQSAVQTIQARGEHGAGLFIAHDDTRHTMDMASTNNRIPRLFPGASYSKRNIRNFVAFSDHRQLATSSGILTSEFSSFSWTAAQMGGVPYFVLTCSPKCQAYRCTDCSSGTPALVVLHDS